MFWEALWNIMAVIGCGCTIFTIIFIVTIIIRSDNEDKKLFSKYFRKDDDEWL